MALKFSPITKDQWISVVKNALIAGAAAFVAVISASSDHLDSAAWLAALSAALAAIVKMVEKVFTEG